MLNKSRFEAFFFSKHIIVYFSSGIIMYVSDRFLKAHVGDVADDRGILHVFAVFSSDALMRTVPQARLITTTHNFIHVDGTHTYGQEIITVFEWGPYLYGSRINYDRLNPYYLLVI